MNKLLASGMGCKQVQAGEGLPEAPAPPASAEGWRLTGRKRQTGCCFQRAGRLYRRFTEMPVPVACKKGSSVVKAGTGETGLRM